VSGEVRVANIMTAPQTPDKRKMHAAPVLRDEPTARLGRC